jgi:DNA-directed RNA polymerase sigma subunit (sigma70/sigma32)
MKRGSERNRAIAKEREGGMTLEEIGKRYGINRERVRQIVIKEARGAAGIGFKRT